MCCSQYGYCGYGDAYCKSTAREEDTTTTEESPHVGALATPAFIAVIVCSVFAVAVLVALAVFLYKRSHSSPETI
jgi:hypothetical protein